MAESYTPYKNVESGLAPGTIKGLLPMDGEDASAFRYRKELFFHVDLSRFTSTASQIISASWKNQLLDAPKGKVLFEQEVTYRIAVTALTDPFFGGIGLVTWQPLDGGNGKIQTTIINGQTIDPTTAWQSVDTPIPTEFSETTGYTIFAPEGVATVGGYDFFGTWYSPGYLCDLPAGGVLDRVFDRWGIGTLLTEATYAFGFKLAASDRICLDKYLGKTWWFHKAAGALRMAQTRRHEAPALRDTDTVVIDEVPSAFRAHRVGGELWCVLGQKKLGLQKLGLRVSSDDGGEWSQTMAIDDNSKLLASVPSADGSTLYVLSQATATEIDSSKNLDDLVKQGEIIRVVARRGGEESQPWQIVHRARTHGAALPAKVTSLFLDDGTFRLLAKDGNTTRLYLSHDEMNTWEEITADA